MPLSGGALRASTANNPATSRWVSSVTSTVPAAAASCTRAAILGASPNTSASLPAPAPTTTEPESPDPRRQLWTPRLLVELGDGFDNRQAGAHGPLRVIVVRLRIA